MSHTLLFVDELIQLSKGKNIKENPFSKARPLFLTF